MISDNWKFMGASLKGRAHITSDLPCQDAHYFEVLEHSRGMAIVCDGAGSCENSHLGSSFVAERTAFYLKEMIRGNKLLNEEETLNPEVWEGKVRELVATLQEELNSYAEQEAVSYKSLSCTWIVLLFSPHRLLAAHIGDGRAGYADGEDKWHPAITPFKGEQVGQTVFLTTEMPGEEENPFIETRVVEGEIRGVTAMSDGCELACWRCYDKKPDVEQYYDPNEPYSQFFEQTTSTLKHLYDEGLSQESIIAKWEAFLDNGNTALQKETDDKTMILGIWMAEQETESLPTEDEANH